MIDSFDPRTHNARSDELAGRVIAVTGASSGIGRAVAIACARFGATVILIGRNARKLETVHGEIEAAGSPEPTIAVLDLEKAIASDYDKLASAVAERFGRLDGLLFFVGFFGLLSLFVFFVFSLLCCVLF